MHFLRPMVAGFIYLLGLLSALPDALPDSTSHKLSTWHSEHTLAVGLEVLSSAHFLPEMDGSADGDRGHLGYQLDLILAPLNDGLPIGTPQLAIAPTPRRLSLIRAPPIFPS